MSTPPRHPQEPGRDTAAPARDGEGAVARPDAWEAAAAAYAARVNEIATRAAAAAAAGDTDAPDGGDAADGAREREAVRATPAPLTPTPAAETVVAKTPVPATPSAAEAAAAARFASAARAARLVAPGDATPAARDAGPTAPGDATPVARDAGPTYVRPTPDARDPVIRPATPATSQTSTPTPRSPGASEAATPTVATGTQRSTIPTYGRPAPDPRDAISPAAPPAAWPAPPAAWPAPPPASVPPAARPDAPTFARPAAPPFATPSAPPFATPSARPAAPPAATPPAPPVVPVGRAATTAPPAGSPPTLRPPGTPAFTAAPPAPPATPEVRAAPPTFVPPKAGEPEISAAAVALPVHDEAGAEPPRPMTRRERFRSWRFAPVVEILVTVALALGLAESVQAAVVKPFVIPSESMEPTLLPGQRVLVDRLAYDFGGTPSRGDIVVFHPPSSLTCKINVPLTEPCPESVGTHASDYFVKRVIGLPGDTLSIKNGHPVINGKELTNEPYITPCTDSTSCNMPHSIVIPRGEYYMLGDNRGNSDDSRYWGPVPLSWIIGEVFATYWPIDRIGIF